MTMGGDLAPIRTRAKRELSIEHADSRLISAFRLLCVILSGWAVRVLTSNRYHVTKNQSASE